MISKSNRWQHTALALACATAFGLWGSQASALSLGKLSVKSALGEPMRAEIDILDINDDEASSLRPRVALPDTFKASGMEYSSALNGLEITLQHRANGQSYLQLRSNRPVNEPYVDLVLEAAWATGRIVRDYTMLFDPPNLSASQPATAAQAAQVGSVPVRVAPDANAQAANPASASPAAPAAPVTQAAQPARPAPAPAPAPAAAPVRKSAPAPAVASSTSGSSVTVKAGDTASRIASAHKAADVSLDQMLVAMLRANPDAFVDGNVNRLRKGVVLDLPGSAQARSVSNEEAEQILVAQSHDFNEYRRHLSEAAPVSHEAAADRKSGGSVQPQVEDKKAAAATPDKLTLSKGTVKTQAEDKLAKDRAAQDAKAKADEAAKNVADLEKLSKSVAAVAAKEAPANAPVAPVSAPIAGPKVVASPAVVAASAPAMPASMPAAVASAPKPAAVQPPVPAPAPEEPSMFDDLLDNPLALGAGGGVIALLAGLVFYRTRQRRKSAQVDSSYLESRLQPDSFFGNSGGQRVDTNDANTGGGSSSMVYSPSQLDAGDDVDPVAEADVYLAYGRDLQAEEILKEALRNHPGRVAVHQKLLEIYAKRRDLKSFGAIAKDAYKVTSGQGPEWDAITGMGRELDPANEMYQPGGTPAPSAPAPLEPAPGAAADEGADSGPGALAASGAAANPDLDLDLDFSLDETPSQRDPVSTMASAPFATAPSGPATQAAAPDILSVASGSAPLSAPAPADTGINFDLGSLSLDLESPSAQPGSEADDPLATKLALADEFKAIGDTDGARALIEEILSEASGDMKARAEQALAALG